MQISLRSILFGQYSIPAICNKVANEYYQNRSIRIHLLQFRLISSFTVYNTHCACMGVEQYYCNNFTFIIILFQNSDLKLESQYFNNMLFIIIIRTNM